MSRRITIIIETALACCVKQVQGTLLLVPDSLSTQFYGNLVKVKGEKTWISDAGDLGSSGKRASFALSTPSRMAKEIDLSKYPYVFVVNPQDIEDSLLQKLKNLDMIFCVKY